MRSKAPKRVTIAVDSERQVSGLLQVPADASACYVVAHGAGAGMEHPFMVSISEGLAERHVATLRYQFPYMERGGKRPDSPAIAQATVRAAIAAASRLLPGVALMAGGKSFGGRMTSQAQAASPLESVRGLAFLGFPLHAAGKPSDERAQHLFEVQVPMLFLQGSRDSLADLGYLRPIINRLGQRATLKVYEDADHSFHVRVRSGRKDSEVRDEMLDDLAGWMASVTRL